MPLPANRRQFLQGAMAGAGALGAAACSAPPSLDLDGPPNFLVYMPDSLRADFLGCHGGTSWCSPALDALAQRSYVFERCFAQCCWTKPSVASIFTGMTPQVHKSAVTPWRAPKGASVLPRMLHKQFTSLGEAMQQLGYRTACFQSNPHPREEFGYARGFDYFELEVNEKAPFQAMKVSRWLEQERSEPFFLFVHQIDPHGPYEPDAADFHETHGVTRREAIRTISKEDLDRVLSWQMAYKPENANNMRSARRDLPGLSTAGNRYLQMLYEAQIRRADNAFGYLLQQLDEQGVSERTVVIFISDHGEAFGEHELFAHGNTLFMEELHVPMVIHLPGQHRGVRFRHVNALFDLYPTCVALAGGQPDSGLMAMPLLDSEGALIAERGRAVFAEWDSPGPQVDIWSNTMITADYSFVHHRAYENPEMFAGFDLKRDPGQLEYITRDKLEASFRWSRRLQKYHEQLERIRRKADRTGPPEMMKGDEAYEEELRALGYV